MPPRPTAARKSLTAANLAALGADRLAGLLLEVAADDPRWKRRLRMELAAEVGAPDLALEIDKRLTALETSRVKVSWRKRPALIDDLLDLHRMIVTRLAAFDPGLGFDRLILWLDLYTALQLRVKDPKNELAEVFHGAAAALGPLSVEAGAERAAPPLLDALLTRLSDWSRWVGAAAPTLDVPAAKVLVRALIANRPAPTGRLALVVRRLADRAGDLDAWLLTYPPAERVKPEIGAEIARRLALAGRAAEARAALDASKPVSAPSSRWTKPTDPPEPPEAWRLAEIIVLEVEGRADDAQAARWALFERSLSPALLKDIVGRLADFDDVVALDRAFQIAAEHINPGAGMRFLIDWPALREAATMAQARAAELTGRGEVSALWIARLEPRHAAAALALVRAEAEARTVHGGADLDALIAEAARLADLVPDADHAGFLAGLERLRAASPRRYSLGRRL